MPKTVAIFECSECGAQFAAWQGRCSECEKWETLVEKVSAKSSAQSPVAKLRGGEGEIVELSQAKGGAGLTRTATGLVEFDRVLGGGIVPGALILLGGDPGIGKSTIALVTAAHLASQGKKVLYVSGEESVEQIRLRAERLELGGSKLLLLSENDIDAVAALVQQNQPEILIIDSIQTMSSAQVLSQSGNVGQINYATSLLQALAKGLRIATLVIGHVTKDGSLAGPKQLEHIVDTVLYFEGDTASHLRILRSYKNRFGATSEVGVFEMKDSGIIDVLNPSAAFLSEIDSSAPGAATFVSFQGSRPVLGEVQALTSVTNFGYPKRMTSGVDLSRLQMILAVLTRRVGLNLANQDVYVSVAGGIKVTEPAIDLAVAVAIVSSLKDKPVDRKLALIGEVGLSGELRSVSNLDQRLAEVAKIGYKGVVIPKQSAKYAPQKSANLEQVQVNSLKDALVALKF